MAKSFTGTSSTIQAGRVVAPTAPVVPNSLVAAARATGAYKIWSLDSDGHYHKLEWLTDAQGHRTVPKYPPDPSDKDAVDISFNLIDSTEAPPKDQMDLQDEIGQVLEAVRKLYLHDNGTQKPPFRLFYVRLFRLAQLGLEGNAVPDVARAALDRVTDDLLRAEGPRVKNMHLKILAKAAAKLGAIALTAYFVLRLAALGEWFTHFQVDPIVTSSFMVVWVGCFIGVWLSYAIRKSVLKLRDLTVGEDDFLEPVTRLVFAGLLANVIALLLLFGVVKIAIGPLSLNAFATNPSIALLLGIFLGVNELLLPSAVAKRSRELIDKL